MSGKIVGMIFDFYPARGNELLLAVKLGDNAHDDGTHIFPSVATLAESTRQSERSVQYQIKRMLDSGWLQLVREARGGGRGGGAGWPREYRINPLWIQAHDVRIPEAQRPKWEPRVPSKKMGAKAAPISDRKWVQPPAEMGATAVAEMGAIAVAEMGAIAVAPEPSVTVKEPNTPLPPTGGAHGFETFFAGYPRQVDEAKARREWEKLAPDAALQAQIAQSVRAWARSAEWQRDGGRYIPKPSNWLRHKRWRDVPGVVAPPPPPTPAPPRAPELTPDQLEANKRRAAELATRARQMFARRTTEASA